MNRPGLTLYIVGGLTQWAVVDDEALVLAGGDVEAQFGRVAADQVGKPCESIALEVDRQSLAVGTFVPVWTLASVGQQAS